MINQATLIGNLGADPEIRHTASGTAVANLRIATSEKYKDRSGTLQERTEWHTVVAWEKLAEICAEYLTKGRQVYVQGRIQTREWDDRDGNKRKATEIVAREIKFLGGKQEGSGGGSGRGGGDYGPPPLTDDDTPF